MSTEIVAETVDFSDLGLNKSETEFIGEYSANGFDAVSALKSNTMGKGLSPANLQIKALEVTNRPHIRQAVQRYIDKVLGPYRDQLEFQSLETWKARAFYDLNTFYFPDGTAKPLDMIPREWRQAIDSVSEDYKGKSAEVRSVNYKLADKAQAFKILKEILHKNTDTKSDISSESRNRLQDIFSSIAEAGATGAMKALKQKEEEANTLVLKKEAEEKIKKASFVNVLP